jgi:CBS domain-containing protein
MLFPIRQLLDGKEPLLSIVRDTKVRDALALMFEYDYSQLPVIDNAGNLIGQISEQSVISTYFHIEGTVSLLDLSVDHCLTDAVIISPESDVFEALDLLKNVYAIVIVQAYKPIGILTDYDTTNFFRDLSEGLILVEDIEVTLRQYVEIAFTDEHAIQAALMRAFRHDKSDPTRPAREYEDLSFRETVQLISTKDNWEVFKGIFAPKPLFVQLMSQVGDIRNQLAHFRGRLEPIQLDALNRARNWLAARPKLPSPFAEEQRTLRVEPADVSLEKRIEKYAPLEEWLSKNRSIESLIRVTFEDIESLIGDNLPPSAREHRSWWGNDHTSHIQSVAWLRAGWKVEDVDLETGYVVFRKTDSVLMQMFFADLLRRLKRARPGITRATKTYAQNWFSFGAGKTGFSFGWVFPQEEVLRVELYIDLEDREKNKAVFDELEHQKDDIEKEIGCELNWERLDHRRASRISVANPARIIDPPEKLEELKRWALEMILKFADIFQPRITEI